MKASYSLVHLTNALCEKHSNPDETERPIRTGIRDRKNAVRPGR